jgi:hypothetical protein
MSEPSQVFCGNSACVSNPGVCKPGCVCCVYTNTVTGTITNSRCRPPSSCLPDALKHVQCPEGFEVDPATNTCQAVP